MSVARTDEIARLARAALQGLEDHIGDASSTEVVSACVTIMHSAMLMVEEMGGNMEAFRGPLERMYGLLPVRRADA